VIIATTEKRRQHELVEGFYPAASLRLNKTLRGKNNDRIIQA
jgi:hypothetical protein